MGVGYTRFRTNAVGLGCKEKGNHGDSEQEMVNPAIVHRLFTTLYIGYLSVRVYKYSTALVI